MKLVIEDKIKTVDSSGEENIIFVNEKVYKTEKIITKETVIHPNEEVDLTINEETFLGEVGTENRTYNFQYNNDEEAWFLGEDEISLATYGITLNYSGINNQDRIKVVVEDEKIVSKAYCPFIQLIENFTESNLLDLTSELPIDVEVGLFPEQAGDSLVIQQTTKIQLNYKTQSLILGMWHNNTKDFKIKLVVSL